MVYPTNVLKILNKKRKTKMHYTIKHLKRNHEEGKNSYPFIVHPCCWQSMRHCGGVRVVGNLWTVDGSCGLYIKVVVLEWKWKQFHTFTLTPVTLNIHFDKVQTHICKEYISW